MEVIENMTPIDWIIFWVALASFAPLFVAIIKENGAGQNTTSWVLWFGLDLLQFIVTFLSKGSFLILIAYICGSFTTTVLLLRSSKARESFILGFLKGLHSILDAITFKRFRMSLETGITCWVIVCVIVWQIVNPWYGLIFSTIAQVAAGYPLLVSNFKKPEASMLFSYLGFFSASTLTVVNAPEFTVPHILFAGIFAFVGILYIVPSFLAWKKKGWKFYT